MEQVYYDIEHTLSVARLLTEGAIVLFESEAQSLNLLAKKSGNMKAAIAFDTIGAALYELHSQISGAQEAAIQEAMDVSNQTND